MSPDDRKRELTRERVRRFRERNGSYRLREAIKTGKQYKSRKDRAKAREAARQERINRPPKKNKWIERLKDELPELYDPLLSKDTLDYRARYNLDPVFKAKEITRQAKSDARKTLMDDGSLTPDVMRSLFSVKVCPYCGNGMKATDKTLDHIIPRWLGGWHSIRNTLVCCYSCNSRKRAQHPNKWIKRIKVERQELVIRLWERITKSTIEQQWLVAN
jgi:5-methylcytosine-specific restriction endonuclease McrA